MKNPIPVIIILLATIFFIAELAKESSWEVKADQPMFHKVGAPNAIGKADVGSQMDIKNTKPKRIMQPCPTLGVVSHTLFFMGM